MVKLKRLHLKLFRDIWKSRVQYGAVAFIIFLGIAIFVCCYEAYLNLNLSYNAFYDRTHMSDYWITVDWVGRHAVNEMDEIDGVQAYGRIVDDLFIDMGGESGEKVTGRVISLPENEPPEINAIEIEAGQYFSGNFGREILVERHFADYYNLKPGDWLTLEKNSIESRYKIVGIVMSPEYIWVVKSAQEVMPTPRTFGIFFLPIRDAEQLFDMKGMYNEIAFTIAPGVDRGQTLDGIEAILERNYIKRVTSKDDNVVLQTRRIDVVRGIRSAYMTARKDLAAVQVLRQDLESFSTLAFLFPLMFLTMSSLTIYVLLNRLIESQRIQIGLMRAIGYSSGEVLFHYLGYALIMGVVGSVFGVIVGHMMANGLTEYYVSELNMPIIMIETHWGTIIAGLLVGILIPLIAGLLPAWATMQIQPAEAMRPPAPKTGNRFLMKALAFLLKPLPYYIKMPIRNIFRNFRRSIFMAVGVSCAVILVLVAMSFVDMMEISLKRQFNEIQQYDAVIYLQGSGASSNLGYIGNLDGITKAEPLLDAPYRVWYGDKKVDTSIMGLLKGSSMYHLTTQEGEPVDVSDEGILLPYSFKARLGAEPGDIVRLEPLIGTVGETEKRLDGYVWSYIGGRAFMPFREAQKMLRDYGAATGVMVKFDGTPAPELLKKIYLIPQVSSIELASDFQAMIDESMGFFWVMIGFMLLMGASLGAAIIFNGVTVNIMQRTREMATMRAIGLGDTMLTAMISVENLLIGILGVVMGIPAGYWISEMFFNAMSTSAEDVFSLTLILTTRSYVVAVVLAMLILMFSQLPAIMQIRGQNLAAVTKEWSE